LKPVYHLKGIGADKIVLTDEQTGTSTTITKGKIAGIDILSPDNIQINGVSGEKLELKQAKGGLEFTVKAPEIASATLKKDGDKTQLGITQLGGDEVSFTFGGTKLTTQKSVLTGLALNDAPGSTGLKIDGIQSSGSVDYSTPDGSFTFSTTGNSQLNSIELNRSVNESGETVVTGKLGLSGKIEKLKVAQNGTFSSQLSNTTLSGGELKVEAHLSADPTPKLTSFTYGITTKIDQANIDQAKVGIIELEPSKLTNGSISVQNDSGDIHKIPKMEITGTLDLHLKQMVGKGESFNLPGFSASGTIKGISFCGDSHFVYDDGELILERPAKDNPILL